MRLVFAGTPEVALPSLAALIDSRHEVVAVVTRPDAPAGRGRRLHPSPVRAFAQGRGIPVLTPASAKDPAFQAAQDGERDRVYFDPAVAQAVTDGLGTLGQFVYYDAMVMHGPGDDPSSFGGIRTAAIAKALPPARGGDETAYLKAFVAVRKKVMKSEEAHADTSRIDDAQLVFLAAGNLSLDPPLDWKVYGDRYHIG